MLGNKKNQQATTFQNDNTIQYFTYMTSDFFENAILSSLGK